MGFRHQLRPWKLNVLPIRPTTGRDMHLYLYVVDQRVELHTLCVHLYYQALSIVVRNVIKRKVQR